MPTRNRISAANVRTVAVVVDPSKVDLCNSSRSPCSTTSEERPVYIIDSTRTSEDDGGDSEHSRPYRRVADYDITAVRIPRSVFFVLALIYSGSIGAIYVFLLVRWSKISQSQGLWDTRRVARRNTKLRSL